VKPSTPLRVVGLVEVDHDARARIAAVAEAGRVRALVELLPFLPPESHALGAEASRAATTVLERAAPTELAWFDGWYRGGFVQRGPPAPTWESVRLGMSSWAREHPGVVALASFHTNGFVREVAVRRLAERDDGFELPFLLIRTTDWVSTVEVAASEAVARRVRPAYVEHWLRCLGLLERLRATRRREHGVSVYLRRVEELLLRDESRAQLGAALAEGALPIRRAALRLVSHLPRPARLGLLSIAERDPDPSIALDVARASLGSPEGRDEAATIDRLLRHRLGRVRCLALAKAIEHDPMSAPDRLERAIFDDARCVRELARHALTKRGGSPRDFAALYRARVAERGGRDQTVALEGLAEVGDVSDVPVFLRFHDDPVTRRRAAAIAGIGRCDGARHLDMLEAALRDRASSVRRAAMPFARRHLGRVPALRARRASPDTSSGEREPRDL
jgi:hypothetical protein